MLICFKVEKAKIGEGVGWIENNYKSLFPKLPERTRLFRLFNTHQHLTEVLMANPSLIGVIDTYGLELIHPRREGCCQQQIGRKGISNQRWIVGGKLCLLVNHLGLIVDWDCDTAINQPRRRSPIHRQPHQESGHRQFRDSKACGGLITVEYFS